MKYKLLRFSLLSVLVMLCGGLAHATDFRDIKINLMEHSELLTGNNVYITVAENGTIGTTENAEEAAGTIKGGTHGSYGSSNFTASIPVQGCVKITYATHDYGNDIVVTNTGGTEVAKFNTMGAKWMNDRSNVVVAYYRTNEPTTLNFSKANYNPYFAVEAIDPADLPAEVTSYNITFAAGDGQGVAPSALEVNAGDKFNAPKNYTLYKEGATLTGWNDGTKTYAVGEEITPEADMTLTAQYATNEVTLADRTDAVTITYALDGKDGNPKYNFQGSTGFIVTQATVNGKTIDVKATVDASSGKFAYNGSDWHQVNQGTRVMVPSTKNATIAVTTYNDATSVRFNGNDATADGNTAKYTATDDFQVGISQMSNNYWNKLEIVLPKVEQETTPLYIAGNHTSNGWSTNNPDEMTFNAEAQKYVYEMNISGATYFTITTAKTEAADDWETFNSNRYGIGAGDQNVTLDTEQQLEKYADGTLVISTAGKYLISVTSDMKMTVTKTGDYEEPEATYVVAGWLKETEEAGFFGEKWATALEANKMVKLDDGTYKKVWSEVELPVGTIEYKIVMNGNTWIPDGDNLTCTITEAGKYNVTATFNPETSEANMTAEAAVAPEPHDPVTLTWDYTNKDIPTTGPDKGLYYGSYVNDAAGTNNGMHGVKLNSSGWAFFKKPAVAGTLTLTFGDRKKADAYAVNVYTGTLGDGNVGVKGNLIGEVAIAESPGTNSIEIPADVTGIYIERKTTSEGVLSKIVFKEPVARKFVDFEIPYATLTADGYTGADLPAGVTFSGTFHDNQHGYSNATLVVPVDGTVKFTISGCRYGNTYEVKNAAGEVITTINQKDGGCYNSDNPGFNTYIYVGEPTTLTFDNIAYLSYFKAEATDVQEVTITYKDQNGNKLGEKKVFEGDPIGEIPYTEAELTIPEGEKFRGWVYNSKIKVNATDIVNADVTVNANVTPIEEAPTVGSIQTYDLTQATFYPEDHENFSVEGGAYYNNHGFDFAAEGSFTVAVTSKAQIVLNLCQYGSGTTITVVDSQGKVVSDNLPAKAEADGGSAVLNYEGPAGQLKFTFATQAYLHKVTVYNVSDFMAKDENSGYYIVPANDGASLILAINAAAAEPDTKIFLPNGIYDFGEATLTGISGTNVSLIGQSMENVVIKNAPAIEMEGLGKADLFNNTSTGLYLQDLTLQNALDYYKAGTGRAATLHDQGTKTINKNVRHLSYQDTYYSHKVGGLFYFEGGELHGTVDYLCGDGRVYFNGCKIVNEQRSTATISANSELYVFNNCVVENNADKYNLGRAWSNNPVCVYLNTTLLDPSKLIETRWNPSGINCDYSIAGEYGTKNAEGTDITPASNEVTFIKNNTKLETILNAEQAATYTMEYVLGDWAATAKQEATQLEAPTAEFTNGTVTWTPANNGAIAYMIEKNGEFVGITAGSSMTVEANAETDKLTIRAANARGGFGEAKQVTGTGTSIKAINAAIERGEQVIFNLAGLRVNKATKGMYIVNGKKVVVK